MRRDRTGQDGRGGEVDIKSHYNIVSMSLLNGVVCVLFSTILS